MFISNMGYIDPGTGSMIFSIVIGLATTSIFLFRGLFIKLKYKIGGKKVDLNKDKIPLVIFSDSKRYWNVFKPICDELENRKFTAEYWTMSPDDPALNEKYEYVKCIFIGEGNSAFARLNMMKANMCLATTPGLDVLQWKRSKDVDCYVHTFHDVTDGTGYRMFGLDCYDAVLLAGKIQEEPIRKLEELRHLDEKELVLVGSTYMDGMKKQFDARTLNKAIEKSEQKTVLCAPSWGESSILSRFGERFIDALVEIGYNVIIRPHPQSKTAEPELLERLQKAYENNNQVEWNYDNDNFDVLNKSDILISDFSGVIFDFSFIFDKPIICADTNHDASPYDAAWLDHEMWIFSVVNELGIKLDEKDFPNMKARIDEVLTDDKYQQGRNKAKELAWGYQGEAASRTADYLVQKYEDLTKKGEEIQDEIQA